MRFWLVLLGALMLAGCATEFRGDWRPYVGIDRDLCAESLSGDAPSDSLTQYFVTSRLPDCRARPFNLTDQRGDTIRYGRIAGVESKDRYVPPALRFESEAVWRDALRGDLAASRGTVLLYIHGFNNTPNEVATAAANIAARTALKGPVISYHWPSRARLVSYTVDEAQRDWDRLYFTRVLAALAAMPEVERVILVAHSMGSRGAIDALSAIDTGYPWLSRKIPTIVIASGDIDRQHFEQQVRDVVLSRERVADGRYMVAFVSTRDAAVATSRRIHLYERLGFADCINADDTPPCYTRPIWPATEARDNIAASAAGPVKGLRIYDTSEIAGSSYGHGDFSCVPIAIDRLREAIHRPDMFAGKPYEVVRLKKDGRTSLCK